MISLIFWSSVVVAPIILYLAISKFADSNYVWARVPEGHAIIVTRNGKFHFCHMNYRGFKFRHEFKFKDLNDFKRQVKSRTKKERGACNCFNSFLKAGSEWDIFELKDHDKDSSGFLSKLNVFGDIHFIGLPPAFKVYEYSLRSSYITQEWSESGKEINVAEKPLPPHYENVPLGEGVFPVTVSQAETSEKIPFNIRLAVSLRIRNPYRSVFRTEQWFETIAGQLGPFVRAIVGHLTYDVLIDGKVVKPGTIMTLLHGEQADLGEVEVTGEDGKKKKEPAFSVRFDENLHLKWLVEFGIEVSLVQFRTVDPATEQAKDFIKAATLKYVSEKKAEEILNLGMAQARVIKETYEEAMKYGEAGAFMYFADKMQNLRVLATGTNVMPAINVSGGEDED